MPASTVGSPTTRAPAAARTTRARASGAFVRLVPAARLPRLAQLLRDRVAGAVADLQQALARRAAAAGEAVAAVLPRELDAELLEPVDRATARLRRQHLDEPPVGGLVRGAQDVLGVPLGRVVVGRTRPGCRPAPSRSCSPAASPWSRARRARRRARRKRRRRGRRRRCRSRARRRSVAGAPSPRVYLRLVILMPCSRRCQRRLADARSSASISAGVAGRGFAWLPARPAAISASAGQLGLGHAEVAQPLEAAEPRELARPLDRRRRRSPRRSARPRPGRARG